VPVGVGKKVGEYKNDETLIVQDLADNGPLSFEGIIPLYEYQDPAVEVMSSQSCGILQSPCGSGKTQMGIALAAKLSRRTLWITHTQDLLTQSYERAAQYFDKRTLGKITAGKVHIGSHITFATVQTLCKLDLDKYRYSWDVIIVDECHRLAGTPSKVTMFYKVMNSLAARHKYGLSATVHRSDGLIQSTFAVIGEIAYRVPEEAVADKTMQVRISQRNTGIKVNRECLDTDGTLVFTKLIPYLTGSSPRNEIIVKDLKSNGEHFNLILSDRLEHLQILRNMLPAELKRASVMIDGSMTSKKARAERERAIEDMRNRKKHFLFATFSLAKEGLDIPCLDRLYMTLPKKDKSVVIQSVGRIARAIDGKEDAICYDYVDDIGYAVRCWKQRCTHYRKIKCDIR
jgi:superfamily II DNA or RNA helicase